LFQSLNLTFKKPQCETKTEKFKSTKAVISHLQAGLLDPDRFGCPLPCSYSYYKIRLVHTHKNAFELFTGKPPEDQHYLYFYFDSHETEILTESLFVDFSSLVAHIGGNLGLFIGFSCLSIFILIVEIIGNRFK
jgi:hypothetical protein